IHKEVLYHHSPFLAAALEEEFTGAKKQVVALPEQEPDHFVYFVQWVYAKYISHRETTIYYSSYKLLRLSKCLADTCFTEPFLRPAPYVVSGDKDSTHASLAVSLRNVSRRTPP
ncbi:MAG: hypothetical protein M1835_007428, partial [Candelina submexicana]